MAAILKDRVQETSTTSGTGSLTLAGASLGFLSFASVMAIADTCRYCIVDGVANTWEVGCGTYTAASTLSRTTVEASSNGGTAINLAGSAGTVVFLTASAAMLGPLAGPRIVSGASYTPVALDDGRLIVCTSAAAVTITGNDLAGYRSYGVLQAGAGQVTVAAGSGVTLRSDKATASYATARQWASLTVLCDGSGNVAVLGNTV